MDSLEKLLSTEYESSCDAMTALQIFLQELDNSNSSQSRGNLQNLYVIGNRIYS